MGQLIYVVEDDENIRTLIRMALTSFSYDVRDFPTAEQALQAMGEQLPALIMLDVMLPGMSGMVAVERLRQSEDPRIQALPVMLLTAKNTEIDKVAGLDAGADDYMEKPFGVMELGARIRALLRRVSTAGPATTEELTAGELPREQRPTARCPAGRHRQLDLVLDPQTRELHKQNQLIPLTYKEFELLWVLMREPHRVIPREELFVAVWGFDFEGESRTLDMHIRTLRQKLGTPPTEESYIKTVRGVGYRFMGEPLVEV